MWDIESNGMEMARTGSRIDRVNRVLSVATRGCRQNWAARFDEARLDDGRTAPSREFQLVAGNPLATHKPAVRRQGSTLILSGRNDQAVVPVVAPVQDISATTHGIGKEDVGLATGVEPFDGLVQGENRRVRR
jgi:hypothetical protein